MKLHSRRFTGIVTSKSNPRLSVEVPNPHFQTPKKLQITMTKTQRVVEALAAASAYLLDSAFDTNAATTFEICSLEIFWDLGSGIWRL